MSWEVQRLRETAGETQLQVLELQKDLAAVKDRLADVLELMETLCAVEPGMAERFDELKERWGAGRDET